MNCFLSVFQVVSKMDIGRNCITEQINGKPLIKVILLKTQALSVKPPHTDINLALMKNGIATLKICCVRVEVRMMLKNEKIFQMLDCLHPHIHCTRKSTWDNVTVEWLQFFEYLSRFEDTFCLPRYDLNVSI